MSHVATVQAPEDDITLSIVEAVADAEGISPERLTPPLYAAIDPEALARVAGGDGLNEIAFSYNGYRIRIDETGEVQLASEDG